MQFNQERVLERLFKMIKIDSVTKSEGNMTDFLQKYFEDLGYEVYRDEAGKQLAATTQATFYFTSRERSRVKQSA